MYLLYPVRDDPNNGPTRGNTDGSRACVEASLAGSVRKTRQRLLVRVESGPNLA
jgi:hypothetical protein